MPDKLSAQPAAESARDPFETALPVSTPTAPRSNASTPTAADVGLSRSFAAAAVREVLAAADRMVPATTRTHVELRLQTFDDENVQVHLQWRDGVIQARFVTETPELQQALSREWNGAAPRMADGGLRFAEPKFEQHGQEQSGHPQNNAAFAFDQQRQSRGQQSADREVPVFALPAFLAAGRDTAVLPADLPALATQLQSMSDVSHGLRTWA